MRNHSALLVTLIILLVAAGKITATQHTISNTQSTSNDHSPGFAIYNGTLYLVSDPDPTGSCRGPNGYVPCFGGHRSQSVVFNCIAQAESPSGCTWDVVTNSNPEYKYEITIWVQNDSSSLNCFWRSSGDTSNYYYSHCVSISVTSFIVTEPPGFTP